MDKMEYHRWVLFTRSRRGKWTLDQIHNGEGGRDLLAYCPNQFDATRGVYVQLGRDGRCSSGQYEGAVPHIGDAIFTPRWRHRFASWEVGLDTVKRRLAL